MEKVGEKEMREEKPDVQGRCHRAECGKFGVNTEKFQSIPGIQTGTFSSIGEHATPTPPPVPKVINR